MPPAFSASISVTTGGRKDPQYGVNTDLNGEVSFTEFLTLIKSTLIQVSLAALEEEQQNGFEKNPIVLVDNNKNKSVADVNPLGKISFVGKQDINEILQFIYDGLIARSPVLTGAYKANNKVLFNYQQVATDSGSFATWLANAPSFEKGDSIIFVNSVPYARKLERSSITSAGQGALRTKKNKDKNSSAAKVGSPNGVYYLTAQSANRKYKNNTKILFKFVPGYNLGLTDEFKTKSKAPSFIRRKKRTAAKPNTYLYPAIFVLPVAEGLT